MSAVAGWYDDGSGRHRWWDGQQWTDQFAEQEHRQQSRAAEAVSSVTSAVVGNLTSKHDLGSEPGTLWSAVGKPLKGYGAGRYRLTDEYLIFEKGTLSTRSQQIRVHEIFDVDASQNMTQKARGVGTITLWARRPSGDERVMLEDIPNFREGVSIMNRVADEARQRILTRQNTQHLNYTGNPVGVAAAAPATPAAEPGGGLNAELARLAEFRDQGILSEEEFSAAKRRLLGI